jgi:hypothetical protein
MTDYFEDQKLVIYAREMGITLEELDQLNYREGDEASEDGQVFNYYLQFHGDNPPRILAKIRGLEGDTVRFHPGIFETPGPDEA